MEAHGRGCHGAAGLRRQLRIGDGRLAQRESASFTPRRSLVRSQYRPPGQRLCGSPSSLRWEPFLQGDCSIAEHGDYPEPRQPGTRREKMGWAGRSGQADNGSGGGRRLAMSEALTIQVRRDRGYAIVAVAGEVDIATVTRLRESLFELTASGHTLVVDLDQVSFIDSSG